MTAGNFGRHEASSDPRQKKKKGIRIKTWVTDSVTSFEYWLTTWLKFHKEIEHENFPSTFPFTSKQLLNETFHNNEESRAVDSIPPAQSVQGLISSDTVSPDEDFIDSRLWETNFKRSGCETT